METIDINNLNEFVDWISGENSMTELPTPGVDDEHKISGKSIRELIQSKLLVPFVTNDKDENKDKILFFSSEYAKNLYKFYTDKDNPLYNSEEYNSKAAALVLYSMDLPATHKITGLNDLTTRYIIEGNSTSSNAILNFKPGLEDSLGSELSDEIAITYTIKDSSDNINYNRTIPVNTGEWVNLNIYEYLRSGDNTITIKAKASSVSATITKEFHIYLVTFSISSNFNGYYSGVSNSMPFSFDLTVSRSITNLPITVTVYIDGEEAVDPWIYPASAGGVKPSTRIEIPANYLASYYDLLGNPNNITHTMIILGSMRDKENGSEFSSNVLIYLFLVASSEGDLANAFVNYAYSVPDTLYSPINALNRVLLLATLYIPFTLDWGYYTDNGFLQSNVSWYLRKGLEGHYLYLELSSILGIKGEKPYSLTFVSSESMSYDIDNSFLVAMIGGEEVLAFPINIAENNVSVEETTNYSLKLSALGRTNSSLTKDLWTFKLNDYYTISTTFTNVPFDNNNGWDNDSLILKGTGIKAEINYPLFPSTHLGENYNMFNSGATFEVDFKPEYVASDNDVLMCVGDPYGAHIEIKPNSAAYYENGSPIVKTNYKSGERIKLCFVFNKYSPTFNSSNLVYIINNGILERAWGRGNNNIGEDNTKITIGGTNSSIRVYMIRAYRFNLSPREALANYMFDNISNAELVSRNDIYQGGDTVTKEGLEGKLDIIIIEGDLTPILLNASAKENSTVNIQRLSNLHSDKNFTIQNCRIRNHGQSTLSYPITSMKIWFNKSNKFVELVGSNGVTSLVEINPVLNCSSLEYLGLNKNRYIMKDGGIPANKFVLLANYADSSGSHNGSLLRLILNTWYLALFGDNNEFKLRTAPLLFASGMRINHNNPQLNEDGSWIEGVYNISSTDNNYKANYANKTWSEISGSSFPYNIRVAADSFPCTVFYRNTASDDRTLKLLGQYVFMDDKKSDFIFGERSIYCDIDSRGNVTNSDDPFCLRLENKSKDKDVNKVWDNSKVLQIEVVNPNSPLTGYYEKTIAEEYDLDEETMTMTPKPGSPVHRFDSPIEYDELDRPTSYLWERHFELIYPDKEDILDKNKRFSPTKFALTVQPFVDFLEWITDVSALRNTGNRLGLTGSKARVTQAELNKFIAEAHDHLDLYKLAAYYIFFLRFGLVDSVERNAQLKTYDGQHWHYEPWDMDIALGCANNGVISYDPPLTRNTLAGGSTYAFSGRTATLSNTLWDCLEAWDYWSDSIVPEVAQALYDAGLTYENAVNMFDKEYVEQWSETLYNESGQYKYIDATSDTGWRRYLNGARTSHRHWWLSTSMNYYDAKWSCGDFKKHAIEIRIGKVSNPSGVNLIKISPTNNTFFKAEYGQKTDPIKNILGAGLVEATVGVGGEAIIDANVELDDKQTVFIYGANSIEELDLSNLLSSSSTNLGRGYTDIRFGGAYDSVLGARLKNIKLGAPCTPDIYEYPNENLYISNLSVWLNTIISKSEENFDALENIEHVDIIGWWNGTGYESGNLISEILNGRKGIKTLYAMGCMTATEFLTSSEGNNFEDLRLPTSVVSLNFSNSSWRNLSFWTATKLLNPNNPNLLLNRAQYDKVGIPSTITTVRFTGSTAKNECSLQLVLDWIDAIEATLPNEHTELQLLGLLSNYVLLAEQISWGLGQTKVYYRDLLRLAAFAKGGELFNLKGYIILSDAEPLTASQLSNLITLFGDNVLNPGTTHSNLVVDLNLGYVRISTNARFDNELNKLVIEEKDNESIKVSATKFTLTSMLYENLIIGDPNPLSWLELNTPEGVYMWGLSETPGDNYTLSKSCKSVSLRLNNLGNIMVTASEGDFGDYSVYLNVYYYDSDTGQIKTDYVELYVKGVTYPSSMSFVFTGNSVRLFNYNLTIARDVFGQLFSLLVTFPNTYIMYNLNHKTEFYVNLSGQYTATLNSIKFYLYSMDDTSQNSGLLNSSSLQGGSNEIIPIEMIGDNKLGYSCDASNGGINVNVIGTPPNIVDSSTGAITMKKYGLQATISIGGRAELNISIVILTCNDSTPIVARNTGNALYRVLKGLYTSNYSLSNWEQAFYKTDLFSLYGTLDFSSEATTTLLGTGVLLSVLTFTPYITAINLSGCSDLPYQTNSGILHLDLSKIKSLISLNLHNCSTMNGSTLDLTGHEETTTIDLTGTLVNIIVPSNSYISSLDLGSPNTISITNPRTLTPNEVTIESSLNLTTITLVGVNLDSVCGYTLFNKLYS